MKKTLLIGLTAVALGSMTACSNILEEEGIVSPSAKTGTLTIALETDGSLDVATKSESSQVTLTSDQMDDFVITATKVEDNSSSSVALTYKDDAYYGVLPVGEYSVKAIYDKMNNKVLDWDTPIFEGNSSANITVEKGRQAETTITADLKNSQIVLDTEAYQIFEDLVNVSDLYVYSGTSEPSDENDKYSLIENTNKTLYVKANQSDVKIVVKGNLASGGDPIEFTTNIKTKESNTTTEAKQYKVKYSLSTENGKMKITVNINGTITEEIIDAKVSPYGE